MKFTPFYCSDFSRWILLRLLETVSRKDWNQNRPACLQASQQRMKEHRLVLTRQSPETNLIVQRISTTGTRDKELELSSSLPWWPLYRNRSNPKILPLAILTLKCHKRTWSSAMFAPAVPQLMTNFHFESTFVETFMVSVSALGQALGPLLTAPFSELYSRPPVYLGSGFSFWCSPLGVGWVPTWGCWWVFDS